LRADAARVIREDDVPSAMGWTIGGLATLAAIWMFAI
jgi:hypothetical protein